MAVRLLVLVLTALPAPLAPISPAPAVRETADACTTPAPEIEPAAFKVAEFVAALPTP